GGIASANGDNSVGTLSLLGGATVTGMDLSLAQGFGSNATLNVSGRSELFLSGFVDNQNGNANSTIDLSNGGAISLFGGWNLGTQGSGATLDVTHGGRVSIDPSFSLFNGSAINHSGGTFQVDGDYNQNNEGFLTWVLGQGGGHMEVLGDAGIFPGSSGLTLQRSNNARFGDAVTLTAASLVGTSFADVGLTGAFGTDLGLGLDLDSRDISNGMQFTAVVDGTVDDTAFGTVGVDQLFDQDVKALLFQPINNNSLTLDSTGTEKTLVALNGDVTTGNIEVSGDADSRLVLNGSASAASASVLVAGDSGTANLTVGAAGDFSVSGTLIVGDDGTGLGETFIYGTATANGVVIGNQAGATGSLLVDAGELTVGSGGIDIGFFGSGDLTVE
ncbi:MAG: hypothetical protein GY778_06560, partial [bacterium]|nr:hypothetical protein [bacterium]